MSRAETMAVLTPGLVAGICTEDADGRLQAVPVWIEETSVETVSARLVGDTSLGVGSVCLVADEFASYVGIRGAIVRGTIDAEAVDGRVLLSVTHASGFSFENTTTSL